jgi:hypothetical protein
MHQDITRRLIMILHSSGLARLTGPLSHSFGGKRVVVGGEAASAGHGQVAWICVYRPLSQSGRMQYEEIKKTP